MIKLTRGDTLNLTVTITIDDSEDEYKIQEGDKLVFTLKKNTNTKQILIQKQIYDGQLKINPEDTANLSYGIYYFDVQLTLANGDVHTIIRPSKFEIMEEVNFEY